jgi:hypothetical protein
MLQVGATGIKEEEQDYGNTILEQGIFTYKMEGSGEM